MYLRNSRDRRKSSRWSWVVAVFAIAGVCVALYMVYLYSTLHMPKSFPWKRHQTSEAEAAQIESPPEPWEEPPSPALESMVSDVMAEAVELEEQGNLLEAREKLLTALAEPLPRIQRERVEEALGRINIALLTTPRKMPGKVEYIIKSGDSMAKIASDFVCPVSLIQKINTITNPGLIQEGDMLYVMDHPKFALDISKRDNTLLVTLDGKFFKRYPVGTGAYGKTPVGTFIIVKKEENPVWWPSGRKAIPFGDKENILGTRWMEIEATAGTTPVRGYGIHGTWDDDSIGKQASAGCIRMHNADVEEIYMMIPRGTSVTITEN